MATADKEDWCASLTKDVQRVAKKQKITAKSALDSVNALLAEVASARAAATAGVPREAAAVRARLEELGAAATASTSASTKELTAVVGKLGKARCVLCTASAHACHVCAL